MRPGLCTIAIAVALGLGSAAHAEEQRHALSLFHFNVQYVAGGLLGFPAYQGKLRPEEVEDMIIEESLRPVLELYAAHPMWGTNIEMQGYLLDVLAARHPETLTLLRDMALSGQIEVVSFHYSDQLFIAYPAVDWERSQALTVKTFETHDVPLGTSVFCQEGQSGGGLASRMTERGYRTMVWPKNLWIAQHGDFAPDPLYDFGDANLVVAGLPSSYDDGDLQLETTWTFFDDGELLATGDWNPYFPDFFLEDAEALAEYESRLQDLEADGWSISTIAQYEEAIADRVASSQAPPLLDGTWQPQSTDGVSKWLGARSIWAVSGPPHDRDNHVRSLNYVAHRELIAAETAAVAAGIDAREALDAAWRMLAMGEVTDASGINPYRGEVEYGLAHTTEALRIARDIIEDARTQAALDPPLTIDPIAGTMVAGEFPLFVRADESRPRMTVDLYAEDPARHLEQQWAQVDDSLWRLTIRFSPGDNEIPVVGATFRGELTDTIVTTRALRDDATHAFSRADFSFAEFKLALPLGLLSVGPDRFLIKDTGRVHVAASVGREHGDVTFEDGTLAIDEPGTWVFYVFEGSADDALQLAHRINSERSLVR